MPATLERRTTTIEDAEAKAGKDLAAARMELKSFKAETDIILKQRKNGEQEITSRIHAASTALADLAQKRLNTITSQDGTPQAVRYDEFTLVHEHNRAMPNGAIVEWLNDPSAPRLIVPADIYRREVDARGARLRKAQSKQEAATHDDQWAWAEARRGAANAGEAFTTPMPAPRPEPTCWAEFVALKDAGEG